MPVAKMVGSNRIIRGNGIVNPLGNPELPLEEEKKLRERILRQAFEALGTEVSQPAPPA